MGTGSLKHCSHHPSGGREEKGQPEARQLGSPNPQVPFPPTPRVSFLPMPAIAHLHHARPLTKRVHSRHYKFPPVSWAGNGEKPAVLRAAGEQHTHRYSGYQAMAGAAVSRARVHGNQESSTGSLVSCLPPGLRLIPSHMELWLRRQAGSSPGPVSCLL